MRKHLVLTFSLLLTLSMPSGAAGESQQLCHAGQNDGGAGGDASDDPLAPDPIFQLGIGRPDEEALVGGYVQPGIGTGYDTVDSYGFVVPPALQTPEAWEFYLEVDATAGTGLDIQVLGQGATIEPLGGGSITGLGSIELRLPVLEPYNMIIVVVSSSPLPAAVEHGPCDIPVAIGPAPATTSAYLMGPEDPGAATPLGARAGAFENYVLGPGGCKPQC